MTSTSVQNGAAGPRTLRLRIVNAGNGQLKVVLALPIGLVGVAQRLGAHLLPTGQSIDSIVAQAAQHGEAKLVWDDPDADEQLELTLE